MRKVNQQQQRNTVVVCFYKRIAPVHPVCWWWGKYTHTHTHTYHLHHLLYPILTQKIPPVRNQPQDVEPVLCPYHYLYSHTSSCVQLHDHNKQTSKQNKDVLSQNQDKPGCNKNSRPVCNQYFSIQLFLTKDFLAPDKLSTSKKNPPGAQAQYRVVLVPYYRGNT